MPKGVYGIFILYKYPQAARVSLSSDHVETFLRIHGQHFKIKVFGDG